MFVFFYLVAVATAASPTLGKYKGDTVNVGFGYSLHDIKAGVHEGNKLTLEIHSPWLSVNCRGTSKYHWFQAFEVSGNRLHLKNDPSANCVTHWAKGKGVQISKITFDSNTIHIYLKKKISFFYTKSVTLTLRLLS